MKRRQLVIPGTNRRPPRPPMRARQDLSAKAFARALERHGFAAADGGLHFFDAAAERRSYVQAVCRVDPIRINRRATLARLIRSKGEKS